MTPGSILIVDDQPVNVELAKFLLAIEGYVVHTAPDAETALRLLPELRPELILMDVQLPGMGGLELTRRLKADPVYSQTIVLALTAYAMKGDQDKAMAAGCDGYLAKPIDTRTFPSQVARYLHRQRTQKEDKR